MARPTSFDPKMTEQARSLCDLGATDREIALFFKVSERTIYRWQAQYPEFCQALKVGKASADQRVERSLYRRAVGYSFDAVKINQYEGSPIVTKYVEHVPPDVTAGIFWLKNRKPAEWRDVKAVEHSGAITHRHVDELTTEELEKELAEVRASLRGEAAPEESSGQPDEIH